MSKVKFELDRKGVRALMQSSEAMSIVKEYGTAVRARAGEGFELTTMVGKNRVNASVHAETYEARKKNADENTLLKALR